MYCTYASAPFAENGEIRLKVKYRYEERAVAPPQASLEVDTVERQAAAR